MKTLVPLVAAGAAPFIVLGFIGIGLGLGLVEWQPPIIWTTQFGTPGNSNGVTALSAGTDVVYAAGFAGSCLPGCDINLNVPPGYLFINRYDLSGAQIWSDHFSNPNNPIFGQVIGVSAGNEGVYIVGTANRTSFVEKFDLSGNHVWSTQFNSFATTVLVGGGGVYVGGYGEGSGSSGGGFLRDYAFDSTLVWDTFLGNRTGGPVSIFPGSTGVYVTGSNQSSTYNNRAFVSEYNFNGSLRWIRWFDTAPSLGCTCEPYGLSGDGTGVYVAGQVFGALPGQTSDDRWDTFVRKYDFDGNLGWTVQIQAPDYTGTQPPSLSANTSGVYLLMPTGHHLFAMKYDGNGHQEWMFQPPSTIAQSIVSAGSTWLFMGGSVGKNAAVSELGQSSSLVFFTVNPPYSFGLLGLLVSIPIVSVLWLRKQRRKARPTRRPIKASPRIPVDAIWLGLILFSVSVSSH